jgi:hypothetical protein
MIVLIIGVDGGNKRMQLGSSFVVTNCAASSNGCRFVFLVVFDLFYIWKRKEGRKTDCIYT